MNTKEKQPTLQELAVFLRDVAYSDEMTHCIDRFLDLKEPLDENSDVVYEGSLFIHSHMCLQPHYPRLSFGFTRTKGLYHIEAYKDDELVLKENSMPFEDFKSFTKALFEVKALYQVPKNKCGGCKMRHANKAPSIQEVALFVKNVVLEENMLHLPLKWMIHLVHPQDNNGDASYGGGIWTDTDAHSSAYRSLSFSYSETCGIYGLQAWKERTLVLQKEYLSFEEFQKSVGRFFELNIQ